MQRTRYRLENWCEIERLPCLPERVCVDELKPCGVINLFHRDLRKQTEPWIPAGLYRAFDKAGRLYFLIVRKCVHGIAPSVWCEMPVLRVRAKGIETWPGRPPGEPATAEATQGEQTTTEV